ncbi:MAG: hydroxylacyl-CoA dehydrogenase, partial [Actinobacteria bacterium]|nr:hydroxylacyl-CoA dehydrogenase [Actinomycetota bacterium]
MRSPLRGQGDGVSVVERLQESRGPFLAALGLPSEGLGERLSFEPDLERAVERADLVQEQGPEKIDFTRDLWARVERAAPSGALLLTSTSGLPASEQGEHMQDPSRLLVGHPF